MSLQAAATLAAPIIERPVACVCDASSRHLNYLTKFKENYESLMRKMSELHGVRDHVKRRVEVDEDSHQMQRTPVVAEWLESVEAFKQEVDLISQKCSSEIEQRCCTNYYPSNWWARYKLGKKVCNKLIRVMDLISQGKFDAVAAESRPAQVQVQPENRTVGMDANFGEVWSWLGDDETKIIGIYGMGGVGKTTLLKKINNKFERKASNFDLVIWVVVSSQFSVQNVQKQIMERLRLPRSDDQNDYAHRIFNGLRKKRFLLMLDDVWERLDLAAIGIPSPHTSDNNSKVVLTTRSDKVCGAMEVSKKYKVPVLEWKQAWGLFQQKVGQDDLNTQSEEIRELAEAVAKECGGLPLALITIGRAMSTKRTLREWKHALTTLKRYAAEFSGMEDEVLSILKFSYDSLEDGTTRDCFLYCSLYPEDHDILIQEIVAYWLGEGFLDKFKDVDVAMDKGYDILGNLKSACLLDIGSKGESYVKMHDIVRDLALWIANEYGRSENKYLVEAGVGLSQAPDVQGWKDAERISLMGNVLTKLPEAPECARLETLMLQGNLSLSVIPDDFFQYMPNLQVLDLSRTGIGNLPKSIGYLLELRYLNLLQTPIATLPHELRNLVKLKYLDLSRTSKLKDLPPGILSCFSQLQVLHLGPAHWDGLIDADLEALTQLSTLYLTIEKLLSHQGMLFSQRSQSCIETLHLSGCQELTKLSFMSPLHLGKTKKTT